jgi:uncharacterized membrane protein YedE/YeeE
VFQGKKGVMRRNRTIIRALTGATVMAGSMAILTPTAWADTIPVACGPNPEQALVAAVNLANSTPAADTLALAGGCTYRMTQCHSVKR